MPLIIDSTEKVFDASSVHKGDLIRAQYHTWTEARNGLITAVSEDKLTVLFLPGLGNVTNYFTILANEVVEGKWTVRWTTDLVVINEVGAGV